MTPEQLGRQLRESSSGYLPQRRWIVGLEMVNIACMGVIALYQTGITRGVPDPPLAGFDSAAVNGSAQAYSLLETPDAVLGLASFSATLALAAMSGADRRKSKPWLPLLLAAKAAGDAAAAIKLLVDERVKYRSLCALCLASASCTFAVAALTIPEAKAALES